MLQAAGALASPAFFQTVPAPLNDQGITGVGVPGPERPPKLPMLNA